MHFLQYRTLYDVQFVTLFRKLTKQGLRYYWYYINWLC